MSNMSYCVFRNTLEDLRDCQEKLNHISSLENFREEDPEEYNAAVRLVRLCESIVYNNPDLIKLK